MTDIYTHGVERKEQYAHDNKTTNEGENMNDIAGLMALMKDNGSKDLPGVIAACKDSGYGGQQWIWIIVLLFAFMSGGFGGMGGANRAAATAAVGAENLQMITSTFDRIAALQSTTTEGFSTLNTHLCESIAQTIAAVRNQGDRVSDNVNSVSRQIAQCCCSLEASMATLTCEVRGVMAEVQSTRREIDQRIALSEERLSNKVELGNERLACLIRDTSKDQELARLQRANCALESQVTQSNMINLANATAEKTLSAMKNFQISHYTPTTVGNNGPK